MGIPEILKKLSKTGNRFIAISDLQTSEERVQVRNRQFIKKFPEKFCNAHVPKNWKCIFLVNS